MRKLLLFIVGMGMHLSTQANNLSVSNVGTTGQDMANDFTLVEFDLSWENSWRNTKGTSNWDAAWVFVKFKKGTNAWQHATLSSTAAHHTAPAGSALSVPADGMGVFLYRDAEGSGTFSLSDVQLRWEYGTDGVADNDPIQIQVFAIEMVRVPQGGFFVGSGGTESGSLTSGNWTSGNTIPFLINSESSLGIDNTGENLWGTSSTGDNTIGNASGDAQASLAAAYPKGFDAFYCMKYEVTQGQYRDFLNTLSRAQQNARTATALGQGVSAVTERFVMSNTTTVSHRNGIRCDATVDANAPIRFYCDLNANGTPNEGDDGENIACNYLSWSDLAAYLDWSGLRPMTELEFEKANRGGQNPLSGEFAWGDASATAATGISNAGANNETFSNAGANAAYANNVAGPLKAGAFAGASSTRSQAGASFYGIMDMNGNTWERVITLGNATGRSFSGLHGNGALDATGQANVSQWPSTDAIGAGFRGGNWLETVDYLKVSDRSLAVNTNTGRSETTGGRGVRKASDAFNWTPENLSTALWLDAADTSTITLNGSTVSQWDDKSGNGRNVSQNTAASQPEFSATGLAGKPTLRFNSPTPGRHLLSTVNFPSMTAGVSAMVVAQIDVSTNWNGYVGVGAMVDDFSNFEFYRQGSPSSSGNLVTAANRDVGSLNFNFYQTDNAVPAVGQPHIASTVVAGPTPANLDQRIDGGVRLPLNQSTGRGTLIPQATGIIRIGIGYLRNTQNSAMRGRISEVVMINSALSTTDRQKLEGYLAHKWGLEANLPANHPYKNAPPQL